jgi:hypothetical protein
MRRPHADNGNSERCDRDLRERRRECAISGHSIICLSSGANLHSEFCTGPGFSSARCHNTITCACSGRSQRHNGRQHRADDQLASVYGAIA